MKVYCISIMLPPETYQGTGRDSDAMQKTGWEIPSLNLNLFEA